MRLLWYLLAALVWLSPVSAFAAEPASPPGYGVLLFKMVAVLASVCLLAWVSLRWGLRRFVKPQAADGTMHVLARMPLEPRRSILVVRIGQRHLILGTSESGIESLGELSPDEAEAFAHDPQNDSFASVFDRVRDVSRETLARVGR